MNIFDTANEKDMKRKKRKRIDKLWIISRVYNWTIVRVVLKVDLASFCLEPQP